MPAERRLLQPYHEPEGQAAESDQTAALALFDDTALDLLNINNELFREDDKDAERR